MTRRAEVVRLADALRRHAARQVARHAARPVEAVVSNTSPLALDVASLDATLTDDDVTIAEVLATHLATAPLERDDTLVLVETEPGEYTAVDVLR